MIMYARRSVRYRKPSSSRCPTSPSVDQFGFRGWSVPRVLAGSLWYSNGSPVGLSK
jgi:hypothetical protein